ncbi:MAG: hypothetical protein JWL81_1603 [Verrucomicrobiales bacterium]|nr:hypothetical protein [Verrucomicrobiales bacterium]
MEMKTAAWSTVAMVIAAFGGVVIFAIEREASAKDLSRARNGLSAEENLLDTRRRTLAERERALVEAQDRSSQVVALDAELTKMQAANEALLEKVAEQRLVWAKLRRDFSSEIDLVRRKTREEIVPRMVLADGNQLLSVRFKEMKDSVAILEHTAGIAKVGLANMPADWVGRLALGWNPVLPSLLSGVPDAAPEAPAVAAPVKTAEMAQQEHRESVKRATATDAEAKIKLLQRKIGEFAAARDGQLRVAEEYDLKHRRALAKGNVSSHGVKRDEATRLAATMDKQIRAANDQISALMMEVDAVPH